MEMIRFLLRDNLKKEENMKKHFRKIPDFILSKSESIGNNFQIVSTIVVVNENELNSEHFRNLGLIINNGELISQNEIIPNPNIGRFSRYNGLGRIKIRKDLPKVMKTICLGERPCFGDWSKGSFTLYQTREVYQRENIPAKELSIKIELIDTHIANDINQYTLKVYVDYILDTNSATFLVDLFFNINLLQENIYKVDIFSSEATLEDYLSTLSVSWEFFPPGNRDADITRILAGYRIHTDEMQRQLQERYDFLRTLNPIKFIEGLSGIRRYFGAYFAENLVVFDNLQYGNAIYVLFENWEELSKLSRTEIQNRAERDFECIIHKNGWKDKLSQIVNSRLNSE